MRATLCLAAALAMFLPPSAVQAQAGKAGEKPEAAAGDAVRYAVIDGELVTGLPSDAIWREIRQGGKTVSATLDVCHSATPLSRRKERFVVPLRLENGKLVGSGQSEPDRTPIDVSLTRKQKGLSFSLEGTIKRGSKVEEVAATELSDMSELEFREQFPREEEIVAAPADFSEATPMSIGVRIAAGGLGNLVTTLRGLNVRVDYASLAPTCADLRAGNQLVRIEADPARVPQLIAQLKALPGALAVGWTAGAYGIERAVRIPAGPWREGGALKADALAARISAAMATALGATAGTPQWDKVTRELTLTFRRPDAAAPGLDLTEVVEIGVLIGPDKPGLTDRLAVWIGDPAVETTDEGQGARLGIVGGEHGSDEEGASIDVEALLAALAKDLNGQRWDPQESTWK